MKYSKTIFNIFLFICLAVYTCVTKPQNTRLLTKDSEVTFEATQSIITESQYVTLHWKSQARFCLLSGNKKIIVPGAGIKEVKIQQTSQFYLQCYADSGKYGGKVRVEIIMVNLNTSKVIKVGRFQRIRTIKQAILRLSDGDIIQIDEGSYQCEGTIKIDKDNITIKGIGAYGAILNQTNCPQIINIMEVTGKNFIISNIQFISNPNQQQITAIKFTGGGFVAVNNCHISGVYNGIVMTVGKKQENQTSLVVKNSEIRDLGNGKRTSHGIQVGKIDKLLIKGCLFANSYGGFFVKTWGKKNFMMYNMMEDKQQGYSFHHLYIQSAESTYIVGNYMVKSKNSQHQTMISMSTLSEDTDINIKRSIVVTNNTIVNLHQKVDSNSVINQYTQPNRQWSYQISYITNNQIFGVKHSRIHVVQGSSSDFKFLILHNQIIKDRSQVLHKNQQMYCYNIFDPILLNPQFYLNLQPENMKMHRFLVPMGYL